MQSDLLPTLPEFACDCHVHVIGDTAQYPMVAARQYTPGPASTGQLQAHLRGLGLDRAVIIQPSVYGTDNRCMLDSLEAMQGAARGVAVVDSDMTDAQLRALDAAGVRGLRLNYESAAQRDPGAMVDALHTWAKRIAPFDWHLQLYAAPETLAVAAPQLLDLPVPLVLDHFAMLPVDLPAGDPRVQVVLALLREGGVYLKLSAPYRVGVDQSTGAASQPALSALAWNLIRANPERMLWGSDWPHTNREPGKAAHEVSRYREIATARILADLYACLPDADLRQQVLVDNPARLYRF